MDHINSKEVYIVIELSQLEFPAALRYKGHQNSHSVADETTILNEKEDMNENFNNQEIYDDLEKMKNAPKIGPPGGGAAS